MEEPQQLWDELEHQTSEQSLIFHQCSCNQISTFLSGWLQLPVLWKAHVCLGWFGVQKKNDDVCTYVVQTLKNMDAEMLRWGKAKKSITGH